MEPKNVMHVGIANPNRKRKEILGSAVEILELLKHYEKSRKIKREKNARKRELKALMKEIKILAGELKELIPVVELPKEEAKKEVVEKQIKKVEIKKVETTEIKREDHSTRLEKDLQALRDKISSL